MSENAEPKYKRVLLKLSGEALAGDKEIGLDFPTIENICRSIKKTVDAGAQMGIVVGGGNFWRVAMICWQTARGATISECLQQL